MTDADGRFWAAYLDWHLRTDHRWDMALHLEAMSNEMRAFGETLANALRPALDRAAASIRAFTVEYKRAFPESAS